MSKLANPNPNPKKFLVIDRINGFTAVAPTNLQSLPLPRPSPVGDGPDSAPDQASGLTSPDALAHKALLSYGLAPPKASGRVVFYSCDATGHVAVDSAANWNAGRVSHRHCCRALLKEEVEAQGQPILEFVVQSKVLSKFGGVNTNTLAKSRSLQTALQSTLERPTDKPASFSLFVSNRAPSAVAALREYILEPSTLDVLRWLHTISTGNEATQPVFRSTLDDLLTQTTKTQRVLQEQIAHLRSVAGELDLIGRPVVESTTSNPVIAPMLLWSSVAVPDEYGDPTDELTHSPWYSPYDLTAPNPDEYPLPPECQAALAVMAMQTALIYGSKHRDANEIFERLKAKSPLDLRGHKWFQVISVEPGYVSTRDAGTFVTSVSGESVDVAAEVRLMLVKPPPKSMTLPLNYADFPRLWDWSTSRLVTLDWPKSFKEAVEIS